MNHPRYKLRWDWHLRNFLTALIPGAAMYIFIKAVEFFLDPTLLPDILDVDGDLIKKKPLDKLQSNQPGSDTTTIASEKEVASDVLRETQARLQSLEEDVKRLKSEKAISTDITGRIQKALLIAQRITRNNADTLSD